MLVAKRSLFRLLYRCHPNNEKNGFEILSLQDMMTSYLDLTWYFLLQSVQLGNFRLANSDLGKLSTFAEHPKKVGFSHIRFEDAVELFDGGRSILIGRSEPDTKDETSTAHFR